MDTIMDKLTANNAYAVLATPSGGKPAWMSYKYPEIRRVDSRGKRQPHEARHNHCPTSPIYREKCTIINTKLAERYKDHPALLVWHVSNEYNAGDCQCDLCLDAFRRWLQERYDNDLDKLNHAYWSSFWSHTFPDWNCIHPNDAGIHGLRLDWFRFKSHQVIDFFKSESAPLRAITPHTPITTNFCAINSINYWEFAKELDVISRDFYPHWHARSDNTIEAIRVSMSQDACRSMKNGKPWMLMESVPSIATRKRIKKRKEPGMHLLSCLHAVAHGSDTVQYFQWRKSRGCLEKFHGAVVDHEGSENTREFQDVAGVGQALKKLDDIVGTTVAPEVALIQDWENEHAIAQGASVYLGKNTKYTHDCLSHYKPFWDAGIPVDVIDQTCTQLDTYKLVIAPVSYMLRPGFSDRLKTFIAAGGTAIMTYWSGVVDESDLCYLGGVPGAGLREVFGVWEEESQSYFPGEKVGIKMKDSNKSYTAVDTCSVIHAEGAKVLATFTDQYFAGSPALTVHTYGKGKAYYLAARTEGTFLADFYAQIVDDLGMEKVLDGELAPGVTAQMRSDGKTRYVFILNFNQEEAHIQLNRCYHDLLSGRTLEGKVQLTPYEGLVLSTPENINHRPRKI
jgi:beta-galactosidase